MSSHEGRLRWNGHETWYRVVGELGRNSGPSEFHVIGSLKGWDITERLHEAFLQTID